METNQCVKSPEKNAFVFLYSVSAKRNIFIISVTLDIDKKSWEHSVLDYKLTS